MTDALNVQDDSTEAEQTFLREIDEYFLDDSRPVVHSPEAIGMGAGRHRDVKRELLSHVVMRLPVGHHCYSIPFGLPLPAACN